MLANNNDKKSCFIITPIGDAGSKIRRHIDIVIDSAIVPALGDEYEPIVPHRLYDSSAITKQIYQHIYESDLVVANLTGLNPNVMYELAMRFCVGKPVIIIAEEETRLPFDIKDQRAFFYINDYDGIIELRENIRKALNSIDFSSDLTSPIYDALGEVALFKQLHYGIEENSKLSDKALSLILDKLDFLERNRDSEQIYEKQMAINSDIDLKIRTEIRKVSSFVLTHHSLTEVQRIGLLRQIDYIRDMINDADNVILYKDYCDYNEQINNLETQINLLVITDSL